MAGFGGTLAVSIDLDPIPCYYRIHGLPPAPADLRDVVMRRALPRLAALFARYKIPATWFVVGDDLDPAVVGAASAAVTASLLAERHAAGDELGNHSTTHPYDLARQDAASVAQEIGGCDQRLRAITGRPIAGFRAPGYDLSATMLAELTRRGYRYDSSIFPAPAYYLAKAAVMAGLHVLGRPSGAVMTSPLALLAPVAPYRPSVRAPWWRGQADLLEVPIAVTPWARIPAIGTSLLVAPPWLRRHVLHAMRGRPLFNLELHGIDLIDAELDGIPGELVARQHDLRVPLAHKLQILDELLAQLTRERTAVTLAAAVASMTGDISPPISLRAVN